MWFSDSRDLKTYKYIKTIDVYICNGLMNTECGKLIGTKFSFQINQVSVCGTMIIEFVLDAAPVNTVFQSALSINIVAGHLELWSGERFRIMDDQVCHELRVILTATCMFANCYSPKPFSSFKAYLELSFSKIMHVHMLQKLFEISIPPNICNLFLD